MTVSLASAAAETVPLPSGASSSGLSDQISSIACPAAGDCTAVGVYDSASGGDAVLDSESGGVWSATGVGAIPNASPTNPSPNLDSVACPSAGNCVAVGSYSDGNGYVQGLIETESNGQWSASEAPLAGVSSDPTNPTVDLEYVSCPAVGDCVAVGGYYDASDDQQGLIETESDGVWSASEVTGLPATAESNPVVNFLGLSCSSAGNCAAVASYDDSSGPESIIETEIGGSWSVSQPNVSNLDPSSSSTPWLESVSCPSDGNCTAVGYFEANSSSSSPYEELLVNQAGGVWQPATTAQLPGDASTSAVGSGPAQDDLYLNAVSCASAGDCTAVGSYDATSANDVDAMELTETSGAWAQAADTTLPGDAAADPEGSLDAVACVSAGNCVAIGTYENTSDNNSIVAVRQVAGTTSMASVDQSTGYVGYSPAPGGQVVTVSCAADGYCASGGYTIDGAPSNLAYLLDAPAAPSTPLASVSGTQATVSWTAPGDDGGLPIGGYTVTASDLTSAARGGQSVSVGATTTSAAVAGLTAGDTYQFTVSASSPMGVGLPATSASVAVPAAATATTTTTKTPTTVKPTRAKLLASLTPLLAPRGSAAKFPKLRRTHSYKFTYHALEAGRVTVRWYQITGHGKHERKTLVASGSGTARRAGVVKLTVHLTAKGRRLVAAGHRLKLTAVVSFAGGGLSVSRTRGFTLS